MTTVMTLETLKLIRSALYQLRQDIGTPETVAEATDDTSIFWRKCTHSFDIAFAEVLNAHNWTWKRNATAAQEIDTKPDNWPDDAKNALVYCTARELAVPVAGRVEDMKNCHQLYQQKLNTARIRDLESEVAAVTDTDLKEILAAVCPTLTTGDASLPMDLLTVTRRIDANKAHARAEIISAHNWSFCREEYLVESCGCSPTDANYPFDAELPPKAVTVLECYDMTGRKISWKIVGRRIRSDEPIHALLYIRNEERLDRWPPLVRAAYTALVAADVAAMVAGSSAEAQRLRQQYERDLETAKLADSRNTGSRREIRGPNFYADAMLRNTRSLYPGGPRWH